MIVLNEKNSDGRHLDIMSEIRAVSRKRERMMGGNLKKLPFVQHRILYVILFLCELVVRTYQQHSL